MAVTMFYGVLKLKRLQMAFDARCPVKKEEKEEKKTKKHHKYLENHPQAIS